VTPAANDRQARLRAAKLYLVCDAAFEPRLRAALDGGVDVVQLREKRLDDVQVLEAAASFARACADHGALFLINDRPELAAAAGCDGVHVGQDDARVGSAREIVGDDRIVGLSTHTTAQVDAASGADYIGVGPVYETPTKPGRPAVGLDLVRHAALHADRPFFAIGGLDAENVEEVAAAGARRIAVVRAIVDSPDPETAARVLRDALRRSATPAGATVGAT
jgi:thiamine-phosphate pyrophosphorylase